MPLMFVGYFRIIPEEPLQQDENEDEEPRAPEQPGFRHKCQIHVVRDSEFVKLPVVRLVGIFREPQPEMIKTYP